MLLLLAVAAVCVLSSCFRTPAAAPAKDALNVIFIVVDDLNDWVGCYGDRQALTPNIDRLAQRGVLFERAYCAAAQCNPSRASVLSGMYPWTTGIYDSSPLLFDQPGLVTLPAYFRLNGYTVHGGGKVFDHAAGSIDPTAFDEYYHWQEGARQRAGEMDYNSGYARLLGADAGTMAFSETARSTQIPIFDHHAIDNDLEPRMPDTLVTDWAVRFLEQSHTKPFFLAVGLYSPHKPNYAPQRYYDLYPPDRITLPEVTEDDLDDVPPNIRKFFARRSTGRHAAILNHQEWAAFVRGYLASVSYADAQVGRVLDALEDSAYQDNTLVVLWSDNGYHLGEKEHWGKNTLWERAGHVPMVIAGPGAVPGTRCGTPVSLVDLYPTLIDLCGLPARDGLDGRSLADLLADPAEMDDRHVMTAWQHPYGSDQRRPFLSVRTPRWRYSRYQGGEQELYDHEQDPNEWHNLAGDPAYEQVVRDLRRSLPRTIAVPAPSVEQYDLVIEGQAYHWVLRSQARQ